MTHSVYFMAFILLIHTISKQPFDILDVGSLWHHQHGIKAVHPLPRNDSGKPRAGNVLTMGGIVLALFRQFDTVNA